MKLKIFNKIKHLYQRFKYGYNGEDLYNLDHYLAGIIYNLAGIIYKSIKEFSEYKAGYPFGYTPEQWANKLNRISNGFKAYYDHQYDLKDEDYKAMIKELNKCFNELRNNFSGLWF